MRKFHMYALAALIFVMAGVIGAQAGMLKYAPEPIRTLAWHTETPPADIPLVGMWYWNPDDPPLTALFIYTRFGTFYEFPGYGMETMERSAPDFWAYLPGYTEATP